MLIKMKVTSLMVDLATKSYIVVLKDLEEKNTLPIWIGFLEGNAIALALEKQEPFRPMTHDLMKNILENLGVEVKRVEISDLRESTFYAIVYLSMQGREYVLDARPSDAIALALRTNAQVFVDQKVLENSRMDESEKWKEVLGNLSPEDFGKYKM
jgi:bifunctional DNase/RNase